MTESTEEQLQNYLHQLESVEETLRFAEGQQLTDLLELREKLQEVISLLKTPDTNSPKNASAMDEEFAKFQTEIGQLEDDSSDSSDSSSDGSLDESRKELSSILSSLEGSRCKAPFSQPWGEMGYYNAMVVESEFDPNSVQDANELEVKVLFCNPVCEKMKPCPFYLDGHCKFSDDMCRFSHGHAVLISELQDFQFPDFSLLKVDAKCLAKGQDELWHFATVEKCLKEQQFVIKYDRTRKTETLSVNDIFPLVIENTSESSFEDVSCSFEGSSKSQVPSEDTDFNEKVEEATVSSQKISFVTKVADFDVASLPSTTGEWEKHTKGIGSKLMEKMGHVWGQGLGKNSDGRLDIIEAIILPAGKSLDKCIEMRDNCHPKGPVALETRLEIKQDKEEQKAKKIKNNPPVVKRKNKNVFDFINSKISKINSDGNISKDRHRNRDIAHRNPKKSDNLNVQLFNVGEDIKKAKKELIRLKQSLARNMEKYDTVSSQIQKKIDVQNNLIRSLQAKEHKLNQNVQLQSGHKKLTVF